MKSLCLKHQIYSEATGRCEDCSVFCNQELPVEKCPVKCLQVRYQELQRLEQETGTSNDWEFNNISIFLVCIVGGIVIFLIIWSAWKNRIKIIRRLKGKREKLLQQVDPEIGNGVPQPDKDEAVPLIEVPPDAPNLIVCHDKDTQTVMTTTREQETQVDKLSTEETVDHLADEPTEKDVKSPPVPTASDCETTTAEQVLDNEKPKIALDSPDPDETMVKRPFAEGDDQATGRSFDPAEVSCDYDPKATLSDRHLDEFHAAQGSGEQELLGATGGNALDETEELK